MTEPGRAPSIYRDSRASPSSPGVGSSPGRQLEKIALLAPALLLRWLPPWGAVALGVAILAYLAVLSPRLLPGTLTDEERRQGYPVGKIAYGGCVLLLLVLFRQKLFVAAGAWALLAAGDSAAQWVGVRFGSLAIPWNKDKTALGSLAFIVVGFIACTACVHWVNYPATPFPLPFSLGTALGATLVAAVSESLPLPVDDNVSAPIAAAAFMALFTHPYLMQVEQIVF